MKIGYLGMGVWGYCLASLLASKNQHKVTCWTTKPDLVRHLNEKNEHPLFPGCRASSNLSFTTDLFTALNGADVVIESVTSAGLRPVFEQVKALKLPDCPIVITSKGIEQNTGKILPEVVIEILGERFRDYIGMLSGPSFAQEVFQSLPTGVVSAGYDTKIIDLICSLFTTPTFRVYPNNDLLGVAFGGALKNPIAIACGISDGLGLGNSSRAALITRGLHEMRKLSVACGCQAETVNGLTGMGDLCLTATSQMSRNFRFGLLLAQGCKTEDALNQIGMVVEGAYTAISALQLSRLHNVSIPITEMVHKIITGEVQPSDAVASLMQRPIKIESL